MVLIAGDLFHDNKPSRRTLHKTMEIIRRYCMGPEAVQIQVVSDQATNFRSVHGTVNYEDEFYSVGTNHCMWKDTIGKKTYSFTKYTVLSHSLQTCPSFPFTAIMTTPPATAAPKCWPHWIFLPSPI
jgi:hypothetical protein